MVGSSDAVGYFDAVSMSLEPVESFERVGLSELVGTYDVDAVRSFEPVGSFRLIGPFDAVGSSIEAFGSWKHYIWVGSFALAGSLEPVWSLELAGWVICVSWAI